MKSFVQNHRQPHFIKNRRNVPNITAVASTAVASSSGLMTSPQLALSMLSFWVKSHVASAVLTGHTQGMGRAIERLGPGIRCFALFMSSQLAHFSLPLLFNFSNATVNEQAGTCRRQHLMPHTCSTASHSFTTTLLYVWGGPRVRLHKKVWHCLLIKRVACKTYPTLTRTRSGSFNLPTC